MGERVDNSIELSWGPACGFFTFLFQLFQPTVSDCQTKHKCSRQAGLGKVLIFFIRGAAQLKVSTFNSL